MPRTVPGALQTHLEQTVTTLATLWTITRTDGTVFRFTDHDKDLTVSAEVFESMDGYLRSEILTRLDLSVDNFNVRGPLRTGGITKDDIDALEYDGATVLIEIVNWNSPSDGTISYQTGTAGKVKTGRAGEYEMEARGLNSSYQNRTGAVVSIPCRLDFLDSKCSPSFDSSAPQPGEFQKTVVVSATTDRRTFEVGTDGVTGLPIDLTTQDGIGITENADDSITADLGPDGDSSLTIATQVANGAGGSVDNPVLIATATQMQELDARLDEDEFHLLVSDIDLTAFGVWDGVTLRPNTYFDGGGHRIHSYTGDVGGGGTSVFASINDGCTVKNLNIDNWNVTLTGAQTLTGFCTIIDNGCTIENIVVTDFTITAAAVDQSSQNAAGFCGRRKDEGTGVTTFTNCISSVSIDLSLVTVAPAFTGPFIAESQLVEDSDLPLVNCWYDSEAWAPTTLGTLTLPDLGVLTTRQTKSREAFEDLDFTAVGDFRLPFVGQTENVDVVFDAGASTCTRTIGSWITDGFAVGQSAEFRDTTSNDGTFNLSVVTALVLTVDEGTFVDETVTDIDVFGADAVVKVLNKNKDQNTQYAEAVDLSVYDGTIATSSLDWTETTPGTSSVTVQVADGDNSFVTVANGGSPLTGSQTLYGRVLDISVTLTPDGANLPIVEDMTLTFTTNGSALGLEDNLFKFGTVEWLTGNNTGKKMEIKASTVSSDEVKLYLKMPKDIQVGDRAQITQGCPKDIGNCQVRFRNAVNFDGEPYTPGPDTLFVVNSSDSGNGGDAQEAAEKAQARRPIT